MPVRHAVSPDQLPLGLEAPPVGTRLPRRIAPMMPSDGPAPFDDDDWFFEPWWPGSSAMAIVEGGRLRIAMDQIADPTQAFPELRVIVDQVAGDGAALAGTLLVLDGDGRPDAHLLRARLADRSARAGVGAFLASDLPWADGRALAAAPFAERRARLLELLADGDRAMASRGLRGEGRTLATAVASMGLDAISARRLSGRWQTGGASEAYLRLPVLAPAAAETRPLLVLLRRLPLDGA